MKNDLIKQIDEFIIEQNMQTRDTKENPNVFRASNALKCPRSLAFKMLGHPGETIPARGLRVFKFGHLTEQMLVDYLEDPLFKKMFPKIKFSDAQKEVNYQLPSGVNIRGHIDGIISDEDGKTYVIDFKSINTMGFKRQKGADFLIEETYRAQANIYMYALGLHDSIFMFMDKNDCNMHIVHFKKDADLMKTIDKEFKQVYDAKEGMMPPRKFSPVTVPLNITAKQAETARKKGEHVEEITKLVWQCSYCSYKDECYPEFKMQTIKRKVCYVKEETEKKHDDKLRT